MNEFEYENQGNRSYLVYRLNKDEEINSFVLGMVSNNNIEGILKMTKVQVDGEIQVRYIISSMRQLSEYLKNERLSDTEIVDFLYRISQTIVNADDYMIRQDEFVLDIQNIYVDITTKKPYLMCIPVKNKSRSTISIDMLVKNFIYSIGYTDAAVISTVNRVLSLLNNCRNVVEFRDAIRLEMAGGNKTENHGEMVQKEIKQSAPQPAQRHIAQPVPQPAPQPVEQPAPKSASKPVQQSAQPATPFAIPGIKNNAVGNVAAQKEEPKEKKGIFGIKFGKEKKENNENKNVSPVIPVVPQNIPAPKQATPVAPVPVPSMSVQPSESDSNTVLMSDFAVQGTPYLLRVKNSEHIDITKEYFKVGKSMTNVDYQIQNNNAISNFHAAIIKRGAEFYIVDAGSTNHTYVEGRMVEKGQEIKIGDNSHIRMANEEFIFKEY